MDIISKTPKITHEQITKYKPLVKSIALKFTRSGEPLEDLEQVGYIGLINAYNLYNPDKKVKFETYASWLISGEILHYLRDKQSSIKIPPWMLKLNKEINEYILFFQQEKKKTPSLAKIAERFNITEEGVQEILKVRDIRKLISLDQESNNEIEININYPKIDRIRSRTYQTFKLPIEDIITLHIAIQKLKNIQRKVIYYLFEMDLTETRIAQKLGLSQRQVSRIKKSALKDLKNELKKE
ncbi:MAG: sigma-70 family RNA polymerase sigma factor [Candidatus Caldatribacteriota bacterium]